MSRLANPSERAAIIASCKDDPYAMGGIATIDTLYKWVKDKGYVSLSDIAMLIPVNISYTAKLLAQGWEPIDAVPENETVWLSVTSVDGAIASSDFIQGKVTNKNSGCWEDANGEAHRDGWRLTHFKRDAPHP